MNKKWWRVLAGLCLMALCTVCAEPARAQMSEVKEKPPMYSYVGSWTLPRAQWADMEKQTAANQKNMDKAIADGTLVAYGSDVNLVHQPDSPTHDSWWSSMSMAGVLSVLDQAYKSGQATSSVFSAATRHSDGIYVSRYYNWHSGSWNNAYTRVGYYKLKADAPNDAVDTLSKNLFVPLLEKLLADGAIHEYEIDVEAIHTEAPGAFWVDVIAASGDGLDKFNAAIRDAMKASPLAGEAIGSMVESAAHRDTLSHTTATYK